MRLTLLDMNEIFLISPSDSEILLPVEMLKGTKFPSYKRYQSQILTDQFEDLGQKCVKIACPHL